MHRRRELNYKPVERRVLVLLRTNCIVPESQPESAEFYWRLSDERYKAARLQDWIDLFFEVKAGKEYNWEILHATSTYIIVERTKWEKINKD